MSEYLYIGEEDYYGVLTTRPKVPDNEVWVFYRERATEFPTCVWGRNGNRSGEGPRPPRAPWLASFAMQIYKFQQMATFSWNLQLFEQSTFPVEMIVGITVTLVDPASYLGPHLAAQKKNKSQNQPIKDALLAALRDTLSFVPQRSPLSPQQQKPSDPQVVPITLRALYPIALNSLLPDADIGLYLQNHPAVRNLGVRTRVVVRETHLPAIYNEIINRSRSKLQKELNEARRQLSASKSSKLNQEGVLASRERQYTALCQYYTDIQARVEPVLKTLIDRTAGLAQGNGNEDPILLAAIFKDLVGMDIEGLTPALRASATGESAATRPVLSTATLQEVEDIRSKHIGDLYDSLNDLDDNTKHWVLSPPRDKVNEVILIDVGNNCKIELQVPKSYPKDRPVVKARKDNEAVRQSEVNQIVQPITSKEGYDLTTIVKVVVATINPPIPLNLPTTEEEEIRLQLPSPEDAIQSTIKVSGQGQEVKQLTVPNPGTVRTGEEEQS